MTGSVTFRTSFTAFGIFRAFCAGRVTAFRIEDAMSRIRIIASLTFTGITRLETLAENMILEPLKTYDQKKQKQNRPFFVLPSYSVDEIT